MKQLQFILFLICFLFTSGTVFGEGQTGTAEPTVVKTLVRDDEPPPDTLAKVRSGRREEKEEAVSDQPPPEKKVIRTLEKLSGTVTWVSMNSIAVLYEVTGSAEYEMMLPLDSSLKLDHYKDVKDIKQGDLVNLQYEKALENPGEPDQRTTMSVKKISFVKRPKEDELRSEEKGS